jgi:aminoglycoside phosphotransferase (APT) family kinase protein
MLHNPWRRPPGDFTGKPLDENGLTPELEKLVRRKLGFGYTNGFGYGACVAIGQNSVVKIAPYPSHRGRFDHERAIAGIELPGATVPQIVDEGVTDDHEWVEIERVRGRPAYEVWHGITSTSQERLTERLAECVSILQQFRPRQELLHSRFDSWRDHVVSAANSAVERATGIIPESMIQRARDFIAANSAHPDWQPLVTCHGDLWFGNVFVDDAGELTAIIDWDRLAVAPADYELDMLWRFWRYPWDFVPAEYEARFAAPISPELLSPIIAACAGELKAEQLNARLGMLELAYRLGITARFGWSEKHWRMLDTVIGGDWTAGLITG